MGRSPTGAGRCGRRRQRQARLGGPRSWPQARPQNCHDLRRCCKALKVDADGRLTRIRLWDKNAALEKAMKHLGLYGRDNSQRSENLSLQVVLVGAPTNERE